MISDDQLRTALLGVKNTDKAFGLLFNSVDDLKDEINNLENRFQDFVDAVDGIIAEFIPKEQYADIILRLGLGAE